MKIDKQPIVIEAEAIPHSIYTGIKYCFINFNVYQDYTWDGRKPIYDFKNKACSVLFSEKELLAFAPSQSVHNWIEEARQAREVEIKEFKKQVRTTPTSWKHSRLSGHTCNPQQLLKDKILFLEQNDIRFFEIHFK